VAEFADMLKQFFYHPDEEVVGLFNPAIETGPITLAAAEEESATEYLAFLLEGECYAVPISEIREIVRVPPLTEIPRSPKNLLGVMKIRGEVLPVYDVKMKLKLAHGRAEIAGPEAELEAIPTSSRILIVRDPEGDVGILVDEVRQVIRLRTSTIEPLAPGIGGGDYLLGLAHLASELVILLDVHKALL